MTVLKTPFQAAAALSLLLAGMSPQATAQVPRGKVSPDSLVALLSSPDWKVRDDAAARLNVLPLSDLPASYAPTIIALFESEAISPDPHADGEYRLGLMENVVRLRDPRSLRGLALLGIRQSREAEEYVASQGARSIPYLDEAWTRSHTDAIAETWTYMLRKYATALTRVERLQVMARLFGVLGGNPRAFIWSTVIGPLPELIPLVEELATNDSIPYRRAAATRALATLRPLRDGLPPDTLLARVADWTDALCLDAAGTRADACHSLSAALAAANSALRAGGLPRARAALEDIGRQADAARSLGQFTASEHRMLKGNVEYLLNRAP